MFNRPDQGKKWKNKAVRSGSGFVRDHDFMDADIVCFAGKVVSDLAGIADADQVHGRWECGEKSVVVAAAPPQPPSVPGEGDAGHQNDVERRRIELQDRRGGASESVSEASEAGTRRPRTTSMKHSQGRGAL